MAATTNACVEKRIARLKRSAVPSEKVAGYALERYLRAHRREGAFYIRFCAMAPLQRQALEPLVGTTDEWRLFRRLCRFFGV